MGAKTHQVNLVTVRVKPNQKKISFDMAFHVAAIVARQCMRIILIGDWLLVLQKVQYFKQLLYLLGIVTEALVIFFILGRGF